jgi:uncharacterized membrane protein
VSITAVTTYEWFLSVHVLTAVVWVGGGVTLQVLAARASAANDGPRLATLASEIEWIGTRIFMPSALLLFLFGFLLVSEGSWDYEPWIVFGIAVWLASFLVGAGFLGPESRRLSVSIRELGIDSAEARGRLARILLISRVEALFLLLVVLDMALKPGG